MPTIQQPSELYPSYDKKERQYIREFDSNIFEDYQTTPWQAFGASTALTLQESGLLVGAARTLATEYYKGGWSGDSPMIDAEEASQLGGDYGLSYKEPVRSDVFVMQVEEVQAQRRRQSVIARSKGLTAGAATFAGGLLGSVADPANLALSFLPVVSSARYAALTAKMGKPLARTTKGVVEGVAGAALVEPASLYFNTEAQLDYDMYDSMMNITFGGILGGGLHFGGGYIKDRISGRVTRNAIPDRIESSSPETKREALRTSLSDIMAGREVDVDPILHADKSYVGQGRPSLVSSPDLDFRMADLSQNLVRKIERRFDNALVFIDEKFDSRKQADDYIRNEAKKDGVKRTDFVIEPDADGKSVVYNAIDSVIEKSPDTKENLLFKSYEEAKAYADDLTKSGVESHVLKLKRQKGKSAQNFFVAKNITAEQAIKMNKSPAAVMERKNRPELQTMEVNPDNDSGRLLSNVVEDFANKKTEPSALTKDYLKNPVSPPERIYLDSDIDAALGDTIEGLDDLMPVLDGVDEDVLTKFGMKKSDIEVLLKQLDDDILEAENNSVVIKAFASCMERG